MGIYRYTGCAKNKKDIKLQYIRLRSVFTSARMEGRISQSIICRSPMRCCDSTTQGHGEFAFRANGSNNKRD